MRLSDPGHNNVSGRATTTTRAAIAVLLAVSLAACNATPRKRAYLVLAGLHDTVEAGMRTAGALYAVGKVSEAQKGQILTAYAKYARAAKAAALILDATSPDASPIEVLADAQAAADQLLAMIALFQGGS